jgi:hypothetical protein
MRFYNQPRRFYAGVDLHARTLTLGLDRRPVTGWRPKKECFDRFAVRLPDRRAAIERGRRARATSPPF